MEKIDRGCAPVRRQPSHQAGRPLIGARIGTVCGTHPVVLLLALTLWAAPALAIVGPSEDGATVAAHVVMVLNRQGRMAGYCSGLVIAPTAVLTSAHCVPPGAAVKVHFRDANDAPVLLDVAAIERNPGYMPDAIRTRQRSIDLALIRLPAPLPSRFQPTTIGDAGTARVGQDFRLAGFGLTREGDGRTSGQLRVTIVSTRAPLSSVLLWARDPSGHGAGACTGDSGGPVFDAGQDIAVALIAWSSGAGASACGVLTQAIWLGPQRAWIDGILKRWSPPTP